MPIGLPYEINRFNDTYSRHVRTANFIINAKSLSTQNQRFDPIGSNNRGTTVPKLDQNPKRCFKEYPI